MAELDVDSVLWPSWTWTLCCGRVRRILCVVAELDVDSVLWPS